MVKAVTLVFYSIQEYFIRDVRAKFDIPDLAKSPYIGQNSEGVISDFRISGQLIIKTNCHNSITTDDIDMKLRPVTKLDKKNKTSPKKKEKKTKQN